MKNNNYDLNELNNKEIFELISTGGIDRLPNNFWDKERVIEATKWLIEEKYKCSDEDIKSNLWSKIFIQYRIHTQIYKYYNSIYDLINEIYPNRFKPWEMKSVPNNFWTKNTLKEFTIWVIEEKYKWNEEDIKNKLTLNIFRKYELEKQIYKYYDSLYDLINEIYPNRFKPWEFNQVPHNFWTKENIIKASKWMIEEKLQWTEEDIKDKLTLNIFKKYITTDINRIYIHFNNLYDLINEIYPNRFKPWEMKSVPRNFWTEENIIKATKWMIEEKLTEKELERPITITIFRKYRLSYIPKKKYDIQKLLDIAYPGKFVNKKLVK